MNAPFLPTWKIIQEVDECDDWRFAQFELSDGHFIEYWYYTTLHDEKGLNIYEIQDPEPYHFSRHLSYCSGRHNRSEFSAFADGHKNRIYELAQADRWSWEEHKNRLLVYLSLARL